MILLFLGGGYCSEFITLLLNKNAKVISTHSKLPHTAQFHNHQHIQRYELIDFFKNNSNLLSEVTHILNSIPPDNSGDIVVNEIEKNKKKFKNLVWLGYFSTTGVYGDHSGNWVDENSKLRTVNRRSINRITAENQYLNLFHNFGLPSHIFRLPGIYGPKRSIFERLSDLSSKIVSKKDHFFSRIHVEDISRFILESMTNQTPGQIYNLTDDYPCEMLEIIKFACKILKIKEPNKVSPENSNVSEMTKSFFSENKKVSNSKAKKILCNKLLYPNYKIGLKSIYENYFKLKKK